MTRLYNFFLLVFETQKSFLDEQKEITFDYDWLLSVLVNKPPPLLFDGLNALANVNMARYKNLNVAKYLETYYVNYPVHSMEAFNLFQNFATQVSPTTYQNLIINCRHPEVKKKLKMSFDRISSKPIKKRNNVQEFFSYICLTYPMKPYEAMSPACIYEIKKFFCNFDKITNISQLNQNNAHSYNHFGNWLTQVVQNKTIDASELMQVLRLIFSEDTLIVDFLFSLNLIKNNGIIFKNVLKQEDIKEFLLEKFSSIESYDTIGNYKLNDNFNFESCEPDPAAILYLFDDPEFLQKALAYKIKNFTGAKTIASLLGSIKSKITGEHETRWSEHEAFAVTTIMATDFKETRFTNKL